MVFLVNIIIPVCNNNKTNGTNVIQYQWNGGANQQWKIVPDPERGFYRIVSRSSGKALDVYGNVSYNSANVNIWDQNNTDAQKWAIVPSGDGTSVAPSNNVVTYYVTTKSGLSLRKSASTSSARLTVMPYGASLQVSSTSNGWAKCIYNGVSGYCSTNYISTTKPNQSANQSTIQSPVPSGCKFSKRTNDSGWYGYHDINRNVSKTTPVYAIADGTVTYKQAYRVYGGIKYLTSYGNFIEFKSSSGGYTAKYCHLNQFSGVKQIISSSRTKRISGSAGTYNLGSRSVRKGDIIGYIGTTGNSSGLHLHFELRRNGVRIDPTSVIGGLI